MAFAMRFGQIEPLISNFVAADTRVIYVRDVHDRVEALAPFLQFDADAYPVVFDGRIHYVIDAYTTTNRYPYSQHAENGMDSSVEAQRAVVLAASRIEATAFTRSWEWIALSFARVALSALRK